jgi:hypothetical protein
VAPGGSGVHEEKVSEDRNGKQLKKEALSIALLVVGSKNGCVVCLCVAVLKFDAEL